MAVLISLLTVLVITEAAFAITGGIAPGMFLGAAPQSQTVQAGSSTTFKITAYPQEPWGSGNVTLKLVSPPQWVTVTFNPQNFVNFNKDGFVSNMTVNVAEDAPQGSVKLTVQGLGSVYAIVTVNGEPHLYNLDSTTDAMLNITAPPSVRPTIATTTTVTMTNTLTKETILTQTVTSTSTSAVTQTSTSTTTLTSVTTSTSTEQAVDPSTYAWAVSATVAAVVLVAVMMLQRRSRP